MSAGRLPAPREAELRGKDLYGDHFTLEQIQAWFEDEANAYFEMGGGSQEPDKYGYVELNRQLFYARLPAGRRFRHALGFGAGYGTELVPLVARIQQLTLLESTESYGRDPALIMPVETIVAQPSGDIALPDGSVDLITCFDVLHHIPNVSHIIKEFARVLEPGGLVLLREPITDMGGNWGRQDRPGLTPHERGIPVSLLHQQLVTVGLTVEREVLHMFPPTLHLWRRGIVPFNNSAVTAVDRGICRLLRSRVRYHAETRWQKIRPAEIALMARRSPPPA